jgi:hypothetical protein
VLQEQLLLRAGANWLTNYQGLQGDNDWIAFPIYTYCNYGTDKWSHIFRLFTGPNMSPGTLVPVMSLKYTYT